MKRVFSNSRQTIHVWAQQSQDYGKSSNVYFEGAVLYSYGYHYPLGLIITNKKGEKAALINATGYSVTTSKHIHETRSAVNHYATRISVYDTEFMRALRRVYADSKLHLKLLKETVSKYIEQEYKNLESRLSSNDAARRKTATLDKWRNETISRINSALELLEWAGGKLDSKSKKTIEKISGDITAMKDKAAKIRDAALKAEEKRKAERKKELAEVLALAIPAWLEGTQYVSYNGNLHNTQGIISQYHDETLLRIKGNEIETSKGASFPVDHGKKAFSFIVKCREEKREFVTNGKTIHLGHFNIDKIDIEGNVTAGCHFVKFNEVERIAKQLNIA